MAGARLLKHLDEMAYLLSRLPEQSMSPTDLSQPNLKFTRFSKLPTELRLKIWKFTMLPRTAVVRIHEIGRINLIDSPLVELHSCAPVPIALQICQESRLEALQTYQLCFGTEMIAQEEEDRHFTFILPPRTYFSYEMDTAHFDYIGKAERKIPTAYLTNKDLSNIRHIQWDWITGVNKNLIKQITSFKKLESLALSWHWKEGLDPSGAGPIHEEIEVTEATYQSLQDRPDIYQFMDTFITARDIYAPEFKIPLMKVKSINNDQLCEQIFAMALGHSSRCAVVRY